MTGNHIWAKRRCVLNNVQGYVPIPCYSSVLVEKRIWPPLSITTTNRNRRCECVSTVAADVVKGRMHPRLKQLRPCPRLLWTRPRLRLRMCPKLGLPWMYLRPPWMHPRQRLLFYLSPLYPLCPFILVPSCTLSPLHPYALCTLCAHVSCSHVPTKINASMS